MLLAIMAMYWDAGTTDIPTLLQHKFPRSMQTWLWLAFFASFAVKMPMWPVHTWLPDAHVEAPTAGSVILAAHPAEDGRLRLHPLLAADVPGRVGMFAPLVFALSIVAIIYTSLVAMMQEDMKKLIAYSSVAHMGFVTMGLFTMTPQGIRARMFQMSRHGLVSGALFLCVGVIYDRMHTREIAAYGGLVNRMPLYALAFMVFTMANVGLPGTSGFVGEFLTLVGAFRANTGRLPGDHRRHPVGGLRALAVRARHLRAAREAEPKASPTSTRARSPSLRRWCCSRSITACMPAPMLDAFAAPTETLLKTIQAALGAAAARLLAP